MAYHLTMNTLPIFLSESVQSLTKNRIFIINRHDCSGFPCPRFHVPGWKKFRFDADTEGGCSRKPNHDKN